MTKKTDAPRNFSVHMVHVTWDPRAPHDDITVKYGREIELEALELEPGKLYGTLYSYEELDDGSAAQFAVRIEGQTKPTLLQNGITPIPMKQLKCATDGRWWVENDEWSESHKIFGFQSGRGVGKAELAIGGQHCELVVLPDGFTEDEISDLFDSYHEAVQLIQAKASSTFISFGWSPNDQIEALVRQFISSANRAINRPVVGLIRGVGLVHSDRVRPTIALAIAEARRPSAQMIAAPHVVESLDVPENGYLLHCLTRIDACLRWATLRAGRARRSTGAVSSEIRERLSKEFGTLDVPNGKLRVRVDLNRFQRALENDRKRQENVRDFFNSVPTEVGARELELTFRVENRWKPGTSLDRFYIILSDKSKGYLVFPPSWEVTEKQMYPSAHYRLRAQIDDINGSSLALKIRRVLDISDLGLEAREKELVQLRREGGFATPGQKEQSEFKKYFVKRLRQAENEKELSIEADKAAKNWQVLQSMSRQAIVRLSGVTPRARLPQSIVFNLNRDYRHVARLYNQIVTQWNLPDIMHDDQGDHRRGVVRMSDVYERWCFIEILNLLLQEFGFSPPTEKDWLERLTAAVQIDRRRRERVALTLVNRAWDVTCTLEYETKLPNPRGGEGLFPDIQLSISVGEKAVVPDAANRTSFFLLDSKFRNFTAAVSKHDSTSTCAEGERLSPVLKATVKNYQELGSGTYILHASLQAIPEPVSLSLWADSSTYGGSSIFEWEAESPNHRHGAVLLRPARDRDELRRLMVMLMNISGFYSFCPSCCRRLVLNSRKTAGGREKYESKCATESCDMYGVPIVITSCVACHQALVKLGTYWTYHDFAYQPGYNMACPSCGVSLTPRDTSASEESDSYDN